MIASHRGSEPTTQFHWNFAAEAAEVALSDAFEVALSDASKCGECVNSEKWP